VRQDAVDRGTKRVAQALSPAPLAKPALAEYRRNLPHIQRHRKAIFVTFVTRDRWQLPENVRGSVLEHCLHDHTVKLHAHSAVVMPDHVHLLFTPLEDARGNPFGIAEIMRGTKGTSARSINIALGRTGSVWQTESYDHVLRADEDVRKTAEYICHNPVRAGLAHSEDDYPWLWREWVEGVEREPS
jgi:REP-associated tyrosine transposase